MAKSNKTTKLKLLLKSRGMKQTELLNIIDKQMGLPISKPMLSHIVSGKNNNYQLFTLIRICKALNVTPNEVVDYEPYVKVKKNNQ